MNPVGIFILSVLVVTVYVGSRRWALLAMMGGVLYLTQGQSVSVGGFNLFPTRIIAAVAFCRVFKKKELIFANLNRLDHLLIGLCAYTVILYGIRTREGFFYQLGSAGDAILGYLSFRALLIDFEDFDWFLKSLSIALLPFLAIVWYERISGGKNLFEFMGGLTLDYYYRSGHPRCMGSFRHPSLMGSLGATFLPIYFCFATKLKFRWFGLLGLVACFGIIVASNSGGPFNTAAIAIVGWLLWGMRKNMRAFRWGILLLLFSLALVMKAPIYYLPAKVSSITGGGGYHRSYLIEMALRDMNIWVLSGVDLKETADWFPYVLEETGGADMTNYFLSYGVRGGIGSVILLVMLLVVAFKYLGRALHMCRSVFVDREKEMALWSLGVMLAAHISNWFSISYWDQFSVIFYLQLAAIGSLCQHVLNDQESAGQSDSHGPLDLESVSAVI